MARAVSSERRCNARYGWEVPSGARRWALALSALWLALGLGSTDAGAQVAVGSLDRAWRERLDQSGGSIFIERPLPVLRADAQRAPRRMHAVEIGSRGYVLRGAGLLGSALDLSGASWSPPRHLLLDNARATLRAPPPEISGAGSGRGVVIGIVDSGVEVAHPDLRNADGTTRVAWWLDFSQNPAGRHPELEAALGCRAQPGLRCQVLDASDLDERLQNDVLGDEPGDPLGHGTHVASIAAGNGLASAGRWAGVAPEATLIVARVTAAGTIADSDVVLGTRFVFERAAELGMPAVVNLSLGSDFGAHDGSSELSRALASLVGSDHPGRAIVVAAGNSGQLHRGLTTDPDDVLGIHAEVDVTPGEVRRVQLMTPYPASGAGTTAARLFVWMNLYPPEQLSVGVTLPGGARIEPIAQGQVAASDEADISALLVHGVSQSGAAALSERFPDLLAGETAPAAGSAVLLIDGRWEAGESFEVLLEGEGRAEAWVQSEGDLAPEAGSIGALFAEASGQQTVTIPAADPALIAVGASINRVEWLDHAGGRVSIETLQSDPAPLVGGEAFFSSAGPNATGHLKPDVLAPGGFVIAAMARGADPRRGARGVFSSGVCFEPACQVVGDAYAVNAGTSMAAPMVSGAIALLLEARPLLTQPELRGLIQAGSSPLALEPQLAAREGGGVLDVARGLGALQARTRLPGEQPDAAQSRLRAASAFALPDASRGLEVLLWLRDAAGEPFDAGVERLRARVTGGELRAPFARRGPGLYVARMSGDASRRAPGVLLEVLVDDRAFARLELPTAGGGRGSVADGGCGLEPPRSRRPDAALTALAAACFFASRRRVRSPRRTP